MTVQNAMTAIFGLITVETFKKYWVPMRTMMPCVSTVMMEYLPIYEINGRLTMIEEMDRIKKVPAKPET